MQQIASRLPDHISKPRGGRVSSPKLRATYEISECFDGLDADTSRYDLLLLVKRAGKAAGFTAKAIQLLDYYVNFTREIDWNRGSRPIVYQSLTKTALDFGVSERQIQRLEQALFDRGAITFSDTGNHRRQGQRCPKTGRILWAFGVELTPLAALKPELEARLGTKEEHDKAWLTLKRQASFYRRSICALIAEAEEGADWDVPADATKRYQLLAKPIRTYIQIDALKTLVEAHKALHRELLSKVTKSVRDEEGDPTTEESVSVPDCREIGRPETTQMSSTKILPINNHSIKLNTRRPAARGFRGRDADQPRDNSPHEPDGTVAIGAGQESFTLKQAINAASERFRALIPIERRGANWSDVVNAAYQLRSELSVSQESWGNACSTIGREKAAICILLTDRATLRQNSPARIPSAYFRSMIDRAQRGEMNFHRSILGILKTEQWLPLS